MADELSGQTEPAQRCRAVPSFHPGLCRKLRRLPTPRQSPPACGAPRLARRASACAVLGMEEDKAMNSENPKNGAAVPESTTPAHESAETSDQQTAPASETVPTVEVPLFDVCDGQPWSSPDRPVFDLWAKPPQLVHLDVDYHWPALQPDGAALEGLRLNFRLTPAELAAGVSADEHLQIDLLKS